VLAPSETLVADVPYFVEAMKTADTSFSAKTNDPQINVEVCLR
jgi:hypothetical protein